MLMPMRRLSVLFVVTALLASACSSDETATNGPSPTSSSTRPTETVADGDVREIDCDALRDPLFTLVSSAQLLVSLVSNSQFELVADGVVDVDFAGIRGAIADLRPLVRVDNPLGSVDDSLDRFDRVAALADEAIGDPDPESTRAFADIQPIIADDAAFLGGIGPVNYAYGEACNT